MSLAAKTRQGTPRIISPVSDYREIADVAKIQAAIDRCSCSPSGDSTEVYSDPGYVIVEANEWDPDSRRYRSVTLRLCIHDARLLANVLLHQATESEMLRSWIN